MHFVFVAVGTRGDAQPSVAVGAQLARAGHRVTIATHEDHRPLVESAGLSLRPICGDMRALLDSPAGRSWVESGDDIRAYGRAFRALFEPLCESWCRQQIEATADADVVVGHLMAVGAAYGAEKRDLPYLLLCPYPSLASGSVALAPIGELPLIGPWLNRLGWRIFEGICWSAMAVAANRLRAELELPASTAKNVWIDLRARRTPYLHCYSPTVLPRPADWPEYAEVTGWCLLESASSWQPPAELTRFLDGGEAIYVGFGSMTGMDQSLLAETTLGAIRKAGKRAVVCGGWGSLKSVAAHENVLVVDDVPHDWLFSRVSALVHHGGAGTFMAGLCAGKPTLVVPFFGDQPMWGRFARRLGVGPAPLPKKKLDQNRLAAAIRDVCEKESYRTRAAELAPILRAEQGAARTAARIVELAHLRRGW
jgi:UDP:flavonoid glycosyltransferase YjiC (YdhE family)